MDLGWDAVARADLNTIYDIYLDKDEVTRAQSLELFDELEEWRLIQAHYFVLVAVRHGGGGEHDRLPAAKGEEAALSGDQRDADETAPAVAAEVAAGVAVPTIPSSSCTMAESRDSGSPGEVCGPQLSSRTENVTSALNSSSSSSVSPHRDESKSSRGSSADDDGDGGGGSGGVAEGKVKGRLEGLANIWTGGTRPVTRRYTTEEIRRKLQEDKEKKDKTATALTTTVDLPVEE